MPLTYKQKKAFRTCVTFLCAACFMGLVVMFVIWSSSTATVRKYCSGSTLITITTDHGGSTGVAVKEHGC